MCKNCRISKKSRNKLNFVLRCLGINASPDEAKCIVCKRKIGITERNGGFDPVDESEWEWEYLLRAHYKPESLVVRKRSK